ncbi:hypothetical protein BC830DRAFT_666538 [Chytriomyces sp. MP71]|nr:hypothetical protein BC830DRAFT_666538 [Chytriomyces sp. MP71]
MTFRSHARQCAGDPNQPSNGLTNGEDAATTAKAEDTAEKLENGVDAGPERSGVAATLPPIPSHTSSPRLPTTYSVDGPRKPGRPPKSMGQQQQTINLAPIPEPNGPMNPSPTFHDGTENTERYFAWYDIICRYCPPNFEVTSGVHNRVSQFRTAHNLTPKPIARQYTTGKATFGVPEKLIPEFIRHALKLGVPKRERMTEAEKLAVAKDTFAAADRKAPAASGALLREAPAPFVLPEPRFVIEANAEFCDGSANTEGYVAWTDLFACYAPAPAEITHTVKKRFSQFRLAHPELSCKTVAKKHSEGYSTTGIPAAMVTDFLAEMLRPFKTRGEPVPKRAKMEKDGEGGIDLAVVGEGGAATLESHGNSSAAENGNGNGAVEETESEQEQDEMDLETSLLDELGDFSSLDDAELPQFVQGALYNVNPSMFVDPSKKGSFNISKLP